MKDVLFIRHAETEMAGTFCGHSDPPVTDSGHRQISQLLHVLSAEEMNAVYTSDLKRSMTTARALSEKFIIPCIVHPNLREINFGRWEGLTWREIHEMDRDLAQRWMDMFPKLTAPDGERFDDFESRVVRQISMILDTDEYRKVAVVTHGGVMRVVLQTMCGLDECEAWELTAPYCSFFRYPFRSTP
jgi:broad specificity phosphatase PhoE